MFEIASDKSNSLLQILSAEREKVCQLSPKRQNTPNSVLSAYKCNQMTQSLISDAKEI